MKSSIICMIMSAAFFLIAFFAPNGSEDKILTCYILWSIFLSSGFICRAIEKIRNSAAQETKAR